LPLGDKTFAETENVEEARDLVQDEKERQLLETVILKLARMVELDPTKL
jgi:hypothetical protein